MKINSCNSNFGIRNSKLRNAFTMIEIAIALAVIAFALVAIIGVLPTGLNVQKDNREDTIVNQDGPYWLEAIRTGAQGLDHLTNYVDTVTVERRGMYNGVAVDTLVIFTNSPITPPSPSPPYDGSMTNGQRIIGLLSIPKYEGDPTNPTNRITNSVTARVRGLTGSAVEQGKAVNPEFSFSYLLVPEVVAFIGAQVPISSTNFLFVNETPQGTPEETNAQVAARRIEWSKVKSREKNTSEIRLTFKWPVLGRENVPAILTNRPGPNRQSFRIIATGQQKDVKGDGLLFFQPNSFVAVPAP